MTRYLSRRYPGTILGQVLQRSDTIAICEPSPSSPRQFSHLTLALHVEEMRRQFAQFGIRCREVVVVMAPNSYACIVTLLGLMAHGAVPMPLDPEIPFQELLRTLQLVQPQMALLVAQTANAAYGSLKLLKGAGIGVGYILQGDQPCFIPPTWVKVATSPVTVEPDDVALVLQTAGTTGRPKAVPLSHRNLMTAVQDICTACGLSARDRGLLVAPVCYSQGLVAGVFAPLAAGGSIVVREAISVDDFWSDVGAYGPSWYTATPHVHSTFIGVSCAVPVSTPFRFIRSSGANLPRDLAARLRHVFRAPVVEAYGLTEAADCVISDAASENEVPGSGRKNSVVEIRVVGAHGGDAAPGTRGSIWIRGPNVTLGYLGEPLDLVTGEGWLKTGDLGFRDASGCLRLCGREGEEILWNGGTILPSEIEHHTDQVAGVLETCAFAVPLSETGVGGGVGLGVVTHPDPHRCTREIWDDLMTVIQHRLRVAMGNPGLVVPVEGAIQIWFVVHIPRTIAGQLKRRPFAEGIIGSAESFI